MRRTILIVDDDPQVLSAIQILFEKADFAAQTASNGWEAIRKARAARPDLILLDLILPDMDGFTVCESLKGHLLTRSIPVLALTGLCSQLSFLTALEAGADGYLTKPCDFEEMLSTVNRLLSKPRRTEPKIQSSKVESLK